MEERTPKITLVELAPTSGGELLAPRVNDVYSKINLSSRAIPLLYSILDNSGYSNVESIDTRYNENGQIKGDNFSRIFDSDYLLASSIIRTLPQTLELAKEYKQFNPDGTFIMGGHPATFLADEILERDVDIAVRGEGDKTLPELLETLENKESLRKVKGISYVSNPGDIVNNSPREFISEEEMNNLPTPIYSEGTGKRAVLETARGCPYGCEYCGVTQFFGRKTRRKSNDKILTDLENILSNGAKNIFFTDDHFAMRKDKTKELLENMARDSSMNQVSYSAQLSINSAFRDSKSLEIDTEFLDLLSMSNFGYVFLGIESLNDKTLEEWKKPATAERNILAVRAFRNAGIPVHGMMMIGSDSDTNETLNETSKWSRKNLDSVQYFAPIPIPGTPFGDKMKNEGRVIPNDFPKDYHLYDGQYVIINPKNFSPLELQNKIFKMHEDFYKIPGNIGSIIKSPISLTKSAIHLYSRNILKSIKREPQTQKYLERLTQFE